MSGNAPDRESADRSVRVLVVDDQPDDAELVVRALEQGGQVVEWQRVDTVADFTAALSRQAWDAVIADYVLPGFSGLDALAILLDRAPTVPLVVVSGQVGEEAAAAIMRAGARDFVSKDHLVRLPAVLERELGESELRREAKRLDEALRLRAAALEASASAVCLTDADGRIEWSNRAFSELTGHGRDELPARFWESFHDGHMDPTIRAAIESAMQSDVPWRGEILLRRRDGTAATVRETVSSIRGDDGRRHALFVQEDVTALKQAEEWIIHLAQHDPLTGLANRRLFQARLEFAFAVAKRADRRVAVVYLDLDDFKETNDLYGHPVGDELLKLVGARLRTEMRVSDLVARFGGDEFVVSLVDLPTAKEAGRVTAKLLETLAGPFRVSGLELTLTASAGIAIYPDDATTVDELLSAADRALYRAKQSGSASFHFFAPEMNAASRRRVELARALGSALTREELWLVHQPQVGLGDGRLIGVEALLRCREAPTAEIVHVAEESGLIGALDRWVLERACAAAADWRSAAAVTLPVSVNLSTRNLRDRQFVDWLDGLLDRAGLPVDVVELELSERTIVQDLERAAPVLARLRASGFRLALDDFGTGRASLVMLEQLPLDRLKIDGGLVARIGHDDRAESLVRATVGAARELGLQVIAEGVETPGQLAFLSEAGCDAFQGFLVSPPVPLADLRLLPDRFDGAIGRLLRTGRAEAADALRLREAL